MGNSAQRLFGTGSVGWENRQSANSVHFRLKCIDMDGYQRHETSPLDGTFAPSTEIPLNGTSARLFRRLLDALRERN